MKKIFIFLIVILILFLLGIYLINIYLPSKLKHFIVKYAKESLNKDISFSKIKIVYGAILIEDVVLSDKDTVYATIKNLKVIPFYPSLFLDKKIITLCQINDINLKIKRKDQQINIKPSILINSLIVKNLNIDFEDKSFNFNKKFSNIDINANLKINFINFNLKWEDFCNLTGRYNIKDDTLFAKINLNNINLDEFKVYLKNINSGYLKKADITFEKNNFYTLKGNFILENVISDLKDFYNLKDVIYKGDIIAKDFKLDFKDKIISYNANFKIKNSNIYTPIGHFTDLTSSFKLNKDNLYIENLKTKILENYININGKLIDFLNPKFYLEGSLDGNVSSLIDIFEKITKIPQKKTLKGDVNLNFILEGNVKEKIFDYKINYSLKNGSLYEFKNINATGTIHNNILIFKNANLNYKDIPILVKGYIKDFITPSPFLNLIGKCNLKLEKLLELNNNFLNLDYGIKGDLNLDFKLEGNLKDKYNYTIYYILNNGEIKNIKIEGKGKITNENLILKSGNLIYKNLIFKINGTIKDFKSPKIKLSLENEILNAYLKGIFENNVFEIKELFINSKESKSFSIGKIKLQKEPEIEIKGEGIISLSDILNILDKIDIKSEILKKINPKGLLDTTININNSKNGLEIKLNGFSENLNIYGLNLKDTKILLCKDKNNIIISPLVSSLANGILELRTKINLEDKKINLNFISNDLDLKSIIESLKLNNKKLTGKLSLEIYLETDTKDPLNKLSGQGKISIKDGNIWEINLLKGLGELLFISDFYDIQFKNGASDLIFKDNNIIFENINLKSLQMDLEGGGKISTNGDVHFMLFPRFNPNVISAHQGLKSITTNILDKTGLLIEVKGDIKNPKYSMKSLLFSPNKLLEIKNFFRKLLNID